MSALDWGALLGGVAAISWVNWYFFLADRRAQPAREQRRDRRS